jgi:hypothetical protein
MSFFPKNYNYADLLSTMVRGNLAVLGDKISISEEGGEGYIRFRSKYGPLNIVADPGSRILAQKDSGSVSKNLNIFNPKNCF